MSNFMIEYEVEYVKLDEFGHAVGRKLIEHVAAVDDDHAIDELFARHGRGRVAWTRVEAEDHFCPWCGSEETRMLTADERECFSCRRTW